MRSVKIVDHLLGIVEVFCLFPTRTYVAVSRPLNEVMKLPISQFGVKDTIDFPFFGVVEDNWLRL
jgi:hypothetical protein